MDSIVRSARLVRALEPGAGRPEAIATAEEIELANIELVRRVGFTLGRGERGIDVAAAADLAEMLGLDWPDWRAGLLADLRSLAPGAGGPDVCDVLICEAGVILRSGIFRRYHAPETE